MMMQGYFYRSEVGWGAVCTSSGGTLRLPSCPCSQRKCWQPPNTKSSLYNSQLTLRFLPELLINLAQPLLGLRHFGREASILLVH